MGVVPKRSPERPQEGGDGPTPDVLLPAWGGERLVADAPGAIAGKEEESIAPDAPLDGEDGGAWIPALDFADAEFTLHLAMGDFQFPALPQPGEEGRDGQRQLPGDIVGAGQILGQILGETWGEGGRDGVDQVEAGLHLLALGMTFAHLPGALSLPAGICPKFCVRRTIFEAHRSQRLA